MKKQKRVQMEIRLPEKIAKTIKSVAHKNKVSYGKVIENWFNVFFKVLD